MARDDDDGFGIDIRGIDIRGTTNALDCDCCGTGIVV